MSAAGVRSSFSVVVSLVLIRAVRAGIDEGHAPGVSTAEAKRMKELEQENRELKRANEILKRAASSFGAELDRPSVRGCGPRRERVADPDLQVRGRQSLVMVGGR